MENLEDQEKLKTILNNAIELNKSLETYRQFLIIYSEIINTSENKKTFIGVMSYISVIGQITNNLLVLR